MGSTREAPYRLARGGMIDREARLRFKIDGVPLVGHAGDTLASALLASGRRVVGRSFKYHRPRGVLTAGSEVARSVRRVRTAPRRAGPSLAAISGLTRTAIFSLPFRSHLHKSAESGSSVIPERRRTFDERHHPGPVHRRRMSSASARASRSSRLGGGQRGELRGTCMNVHANARRSTLDRRFSTLHDRARVEVQSRERV